MIYDDALRAVFRSMPCPYEDLVAHVVEYEHWLTLRLYRDNFESFGHFQKLAITQWVEEVMQTMSKFTTIYLEVFPNVPEGLRH